MYQIFVISVVVAACVASPTPCLDAYTKVSNPCLNNLASQVYFPHPYDQSKFIQCDKFQNMYVTQCPGDRLFSTVTYTCRPRAPVVVNPQYPVVGGVVTGTNYNNPCNQAAIASGQIYFPVAGDASKFIECDLTGHAHVMPCAAGLIWDQNKLTCVYKVQTNGAVKPQQGNGNTGTGTGIVTGNGIYLGNGIPTGNGSMMQVLNGLANPCSQTNISAKRLYWPHPDPSKFIQCDLWGQAFVVTCPAGRVWNQFYETCANAFQPFIAPRNATPKE